MKLRKKINRMGLLITTAALYLNAAVIGISIPDTSLTVGDTVMVPVYVDSSFTGLEVVSFENRFYFNNSYMDLISIETSGTISENLAEVQYEVDYASSYEYVHVAGAGAETLTGKGVLYYFKFHLKAPGYAYIYLHDGDTYNFFNEGDPALILNRQGPVRIQALPTINIYPDNNTLVVGNQLQYNVSSAVGPNSWWTGDENVATINASGLLTAVGPGFTKVYVEDSRGVKDSTTTGLRVHPFHLYVRDSSFYNGETVTFPVYLQNDMTPYDIFSGQIQLGYDDRYLNILGVYHSGTLLDGLNFEWTSNEDFINVSFASDAALSGQGILFWMEVLLHNPYTYNINTTISFSSAMFNEDLSSTFDNGSMQIKVVPDLIVTPTGGEIYAGETIQFSSSNGFPPIQWWTSDTNLAVIDDNGLMTAVSGGNVLVHALDSLGGGWTSGNILINDLHLYMKDTVAAIGQPFDLPLYIRPYRSGIEVFAFQATMLIDTSLMHFVEIVTEGSGMEGWSFDSFMEGDTLRFAAAGDLPFDGSEVSCFLRFLVDDSTALTDLTYLDFETFLFNEGLPTATSMGAEITFIPPLPAADIAFADIDSVTVDSVFTIPIIVGDLTGLGVVSYEFTFTYDAAVVNVSGFSKTGTLSSSLSVIANDASPGQYTIAAAGTDTLIGSGNLLLLEFTALGPGISNQHWTKFMFNEGIPIALTTDGMIYVKDIPTSVDDDKLSPRQFVLEQNYPNPFNPTTIIRYQLPEVGNVSITVYNSLGQKIRNLFSGTQQMGVHQVSWDGLDDSGQGVSSGVYFYNLKTQNFSQTKKMLLVQ